MQLLWRVGVIEVTELPWTLVTPNNIFPIMRFSTLILALLTLIPLGMSAQDCSPSRSRCSRGGLVYGELGGSAQYWVARTDEAPSTFAQDQIGGQLNGMIGLRFDRDRRRANVIGVWGTLGLPSAQSLERQLNILGRSDATTDDPVDNRYREVEAGILLRERLRLSAGRGEQYLTAADGTETLLNYYTGTAGLNLRLGRSLSWNSAATIALGGDYGDPVWRASTGLMYYFDAI